MKRITCSMAVLSWMCVTSLAAADDGGGHGHRARSVVYTVTNPAGPNGIEAHVRDPATGKLTRLGRFDTGGDGDTFIFGTSSHAVVSNGRHLYAVNPGSDNISAFAIEKDGSLRLLNVTPSMGARPTTLTLHDDLLYVGNQGRPELDVPQAGGFSGFRVQDDGSLAPLPGSTMPVPVLDGISDVLFNARGNRLVAARAGKGAVEAFTVGRDGLLSDDQQVGDLPGPIGGTFSPVHEDQFFFGLALTRPAVASFRLPRHGAPQVITIADDPSLVDQCWTAITPDGKRLWASTPVPQGLTLYSVDRDGRLTQRTTTFATDGIASLDVSMDPAGRYLYRLRSLDLASFGRNPVIPRIDAYRVVPGDTNAGLSLVETVNLPADLATADMIGLLVVDHPGRGGDDDED